MTYRDLNASPSKKLEEIVKGLQSTGRQGATGAHGVKHMGLTGDSVWYRPDGTLHSVRDIDGDLADAQIRIDDAEAALADAEVRLEQAQIERDEAAARLDTVETETIPNAVERLEQADQEARDTFADLDQRLASFAEDPALAPIRQALTDAREAVTTAQQVASEANTAANAASQAALEAAGIAESKGRVIVSETEPTGEDRKSSNIWIKPVPDDPDTEIEEKAVTYVFIEASNEWQPTTSSELAQAAQNALDAREAAQQAQQRADTAVANAATAQAAAEAAQQTADDATLDAREAHNEAVAATERAQALMEAGESLLVNGGFEQGALGWEPHGNRTEIIETADAYAGSHALRITPHEFNTYPYADPISTETGRTYRITYMVRHDGLDGTGRIRQYNMITRADGSRQGQFHSEWYTSDEFPANTWSKVTFDLTVAVENAARIEFAPHFGISPNTYDIDEFRVVDITEALAAKAAAQEAWDRAEEAYDEAASKATPAEVTAAANAAQSAAEAAAAADAQAKADQAKANALAESAVTAQEKADAAQASAEATASADAAAKANQALQDALAALDTARGEITEEIRQSADGKTTTIISESGPSGPGVVEGDTWWQIDDADADPGDVFGQWAWDGQDWVATRVRSEVIANLDVHKLVGTDGEFRDFFAENFTANDAVVEDLWADQLSAKVVQSQKAVVAPGNLIPDPHGKDPAITAHRENFAGGWSMSTAGYWRKTGDVIGSNAIRLETSYDATYVMADLISGQRYVLTYDVWLDAGEAACRWAIRYTRQDGSTGYTGDGTETDGDEGVYTTVTGGGWRTVTRYWDAPGDAATASFDIQVNQVAEATDIRVRNPVVRPSVGAVLIENGAITAPKITFTEEISGEVARFMDTESKKLVVSEEAILNHATLIGQTVVDDINVQGKLIGTDGVFTGTVDFENVNVTGDALVDRLVGRHVEGLTVSGGSLVTSSEDGYRVHIAHDAFPWSPAWAPGVAGRPGVVFEVPGGGGVVGTIGAAQAQNVTGVGEVSMGLHDSSGRQAGAAIRVGVSAVDLTGAVNGQHGGAGYIHAGGSSAGVRVGTTNSDPSLYLNGNSGEVRLRGGHLWIHNSRSTFMNNIELRGSMTVADGLSVSQGGISSSSGLRVSGTANFSGQVDTHGRVHLRDAVERTTSWSPNMVVNTVHGNLYGAIYRATSSRRYKKNIVDWSPEAHRVLGLQPRQWQHDDPAMPDEIDERWHVGFVAEEVHDLGLYGLIHYDGDGKGGWRPESLNYERFAAAHQVVLQDHESRLDRLERENEELRDRLAALTEGDG